MRNPDRLLKNNDQRMIYIYGNMFFAKNYFAFGFRTVKSEEIHFIQTTHVSMLMYVLPVSSAEPNPMCLGEVLRPMTKCSTIERSWSSTWLIRSLLEKTSLC
ncbi:hypothetical protein TNCV_1905531 [Trichonephila clavipes]|nr:hypothetical protein TNCV_1905531 [Trichonephila clavipes]